MSIIIVIIMSMLIITASIMVIITPVLIVAFIIVMFIAVIASITFVFCLESPTQGPPPSANCRLQLHETRVVSFLSGLHLASALWIWWDFRDMAEELLPPAAISCHKLKLTSLVISHAILNPWKDVTEWDIDQFAEPTRNVIDKIKYFPHPQWGHISDPATVLDVHGRVLVWYLPGIIPPARVVILSPPPPSPCIDSSTGHPSKRRFGHKHVPEEDVNEKFGHGRLMNSPATFQQAHMRLEDWVYESSSLKKPAVRQWLRDITYAEDSWNTIAEIVLPDLA
ncbi:hypothetical protein EDC04DRAFT_2902585 [Pisolithus marmoratus]|nr:hypothetical protein EDC04DRAFT_2902585 [Pisolithus marmoratus]